MNQQKFLVCIDSDGCALNTMNFKHFNYFGPHAVKNWKIKDKKAFLAIWNQVNLFSKTRGVNRFVALTIVFKMVNASNKETKIDLTDLEKWVNSSKVLSNNSLREAIKLNDSQTLKDALRWSESVNNSLKNHKYNPKAFAGVKQTLRSINKKALIVVVSGGNIAAINNEWELTKLKQYTNNVFGQEMGGKKMIINTLLKEDNFKNKNVIMIGDAIGDYEATKINNVYFYPICFNHEKQDWLAFKDIYFDLFINHKYTKKVQNNLLKRFLDNMKNKPIKELINA